MFTLSRPETGAHRATENTRFDLLRSSLWQVLGHMHCLSSSLQPYEKDIAIISMFKWRAWSYGIKQHTPNHWTHQSHERKPRLVVFILFFILFYCIGKSEPRFGAKVCQVPSFAENSALISRCGNQGKPCHSCKAKLWLQTRLPSVIKCNLKDAATKAETTATLEKWGRGQASIHLHYVCC